MSLVTASKISLAFLDKQLFREVRFQVEPGDRIGLVGPNGAGKTTLLRLIMGHVSPDSGELRIARGTRIGYLPQDVQDVLPGLLLPSVIDSIPGRVRLEKELVRVEQALKATCRKQEQAKLAESLAEIHHKINSLELRFPRHGAEKILTGLGFKETDFDRPVSSLSGGWKMRAVLASLLFQSPDLLLLDEPTNHLDVPTVRWLEQFLYDFKGAMVLVSHDREFLNRLIQRVASFEPEGLMLYSGNYDFYLKAREERKKTLEAEARNQEQKIKDAQKFIERFRAKASKARQAQSKIKLVKKIRLVETRHKEKTIHFVFPDVSRSGRDVLSIKGVSKGFDKKVLYVGLNLTVLRGERIAVIGPNGCGKTTLLRMVAGEIKPDKGAIILGHGVGMGYFAQHHSEMLDPAKTVIQEVYQVVPHATVGFVRGVCGAFLFSGKDIDKVIGTLSGGERARVALAKLLVKPGNLMVMDEPTNHLDISSSETLIDALEDFGGTLLFVSHNQSFINRLATKIWDIRGGEIIEYPGNLDEYYDYLGRLERKLEYESGQEKLIGENPVQEVPNRKQNRKKQKRQRAEKRRLIHDALKPILTELGQIEEQIVDLELRQNDLEKRLADPKVFEDSKKSVPLINEYNNVKGKLEELLQKWEHHQGQLESTKRELENHGT
ncbi:MAG: ATP-binding cassette domain-containing protein [Desulfobacteraceae bacterium]|nr:MAG: ATP-binding cassette domain-containing protein [Desulfobacteraceae bacterium]